MFSRHRHLHNHRVGTLHSSNQDASVGLSLILVQGHSKYTFWKLNNRYLRLKLNLHSFFTSCHGNSRSDIRTDTITIIVGPYQNLSVKTFGRRFSQCLLINAHAISVSDQSVSRPKLYRYSITRIGDISEALNRWYVRWSISRSTMTALLLRAMHLIRKDKKYCSVDQTFW